MEKVHPKSALAEDLSVFGLANDETGLAKTLKDCVGYEGLTAKEYEDLVEQVLFQLKFGHPELFPH